MRTWLCGCLSVMQELSSTSRDRSTPLKGAYLLLEKKKQLSSPAPLTLLRSQKISTLASGPCSSSLTIHLQNKPANPPCTPSPTLIQATTETPELKHWPPNTPKQKRQDARSKYQAAPGSLKPGLQILLNSN